MLGSATCVIDRSRASSRIDALSTPRTRAGRCTAGSVRSTGPILCGPTAKRKQSLVGVRQPASVADMWNDSSGYEARGRGGRPMIAVIGATGQQGGATARALLEAGADVRALVRDPDADAAVAVKEAGAELVRADAEDAEALRAALDGTDALFAMATFAGPDGTEGEVRRGRLIADAARDAGVPHVVYSSVGGAERHTGIPHFESKRRVEEHMTALGLHTTFVRPTFFMENFTRFLTPATEDGVVVLRAPLAPGVPLQMVAVDDIGVAAAAAL